MMTENVKALIKYRMDQAEESLEAAKILLDKDLIRQCVNRAYYGMFYSVLALLAIGKKETSRHSGAISLFDKEFVKEGLFTKEFSRWLHEAFDLRQRSDYGPSFDLSREQAERTLQNAVMFVKGVKEVLTRKTNELNP